MPKRVLVGKVVSSKPDKTVIVEVTRTVKHPRYHKVIKRRKKFAAHDENNSFKGREGEQVSIIESTPISKTKRWMVIEN